MQIQRIQTVYIFLSIIAMAVFLIVPYGEIEILSQSPVVTEPLYTMAEYGIFIPVCAIIILLLIDMFLYRNLPLQRTVLVVSLMLTLAVIATVCFALFKEARAEGIEANFSVWDILLPIAALLEILGVKGINHDIKLLNSYNRLR
ncbi:DUF4293 family protein [uncultured Duncaniella sp.]|uniref:DUF4293 family protein n=1 Tax=uncultured Duncaniella sp. TaxID=2768039 RepID=UPI00272BF355|nr:DUF4293 family protein [uncultured Duncaniella sp.]